MKSHKAAGPDDLAPAVLKELSTEIAHVPQKFYTKSIQTHIIPSDWKKARICPILKKGDRDRPENYRPISLTCICSKILEHIITSCVMSHLEANNILYPLQHGFRKNRSCESQLLEFVTDLIDIPPNTKQSDVIIMDFSKAFDKVPHNRLLLKLKFYGIRNNTLDWIKNFLYLNRQQCVVVDGESSAPAPVLSGVPQGSVIGPALFLIYVNDLPNGIKSKVRLFADDTIMYLTINNSDSCQQLQKDSTLLQKWGEEWHMQFNTSKCEVLRVSVHAPRFLSPMY